MPNIREFNELLRRGASEAEIEAALGGDRSGGAGRGEGAAGSGSGAAAALGVLAAVDEDNEGDAEAAAPEEFEYFTDAEDDAGGDE